MEPDKRGRASLPIDVEVAFQALATAGTVDLPLVGGHVRLPGPGGRWRPTAMGPSLWPSP